MSDLLIQDLVAFGLAEKEARVYIAILELELATANEIAQKADINRSSAYVIIEALKKRGIVGTAEGSSTQQFFAMSPEILLRTAESSVKEAEEKLNRIKNAIPDLKGIHKDTKHRPKVRVFEGKAGLIGALEECLTTQEKQLRTFTSGETLLTLIPEYMMEWSIKRLERQIPIAGIYVDNQATRGIVDMSPGLGRSVFVPKENYPSPVDTMIWDNKVAYLVFEGDAITTILLEGSEIGIVTKNMFDMAFENAKLNGSYQEN